MNHLEILLRCLLVDIRLTHVDPIFDILPALVERSLELGRSMLRLFILCLKDLGNGLGLLNLLLLLGNLGPQGVDLILESLPTLLLFFILGFRGIFVGSGGLLHLRIICSSVLLFSRGCKSLR